MGRDIVPQLLLGLADDYPVVGFYDVDQSGDIENRADSIIPDGKRRLHRV